MLLVKLGTDGTKDWVQTPDGYKYGLGFRSVLSFCSLLARDARAARTALESFNAKGVATLNVDPDKFWAFLEPKRRSRWAGRIPFMPPDQGIDPNMNTIHDYLARAERVASHLKKQACAGMVDPQAMDYLQQQVEGLSSSFQPTLEYLGLGEPPPATVLAAETIMEKAADTLATISKLASEGKRFNHVKAKAAVGEVVSRVASLSSQNLLTEAGVALEFQKLACEIDRLHGLFHPKGG